MKKLTAIITAILLICAVIVPVMISASAESTPLTGLYDENNYTSHCKTAGKEVIFDADNKKITMNGGQSKTLVNYSDDMTAFDASVVVQGNTVETSSSSNYGLIYGGMIFHVKETDFNSSSFSFNTTGYAVILKRAKNANNVTVIIRYITGNVLKKELSFTTSNVPFVYDAKFKLNLSVTDEKFIINVTNEAGSTSYGTAEYPLDNTAQYSATSYYPSGNIGLVSNGYHEYYNFEVTSNAPMANIPEDNNSSSSDTSSDSSDSSDTSSGAGSDSSSTINPLEEKYDLFGNFQTDANNFTTSTSTSRGTLKSGSADDFSTDITVKLNDSAETKTGIIFRAGNLGVGNDNMQGYALILDTTKDEYIRLYLYKYGKPSGSDTNAYLGRIGNYIAEKNMTLSAGKEIGLHLNVSDSMVEAYIYDKADSSVKSNVLSADLKSATDSIKDNGEYYSTGKIGFYVANGYYINAIDGLVIKAAEEIGGPELEEDPLKDKYNLYGSFTTDENGYTTATSTSRGTLKSGSKDNFSTDVTVKLNENAETKTGIIFRVSNLGTGNDNMQGYALILDTTKDDSIRIFLYKYGPLKGEKVNTYLGRIGSFITADNMVLSAGKEIGLHLNVSDDKVQAYIYDKKDSGIKSETLSVSLKNATDSTKDNGEYYSTGEIGFYVADGYYINAIDGLKIKNAEKIKDENSNLSGGIPAVDNSKGSATSGEYSSIKNVTASNANIVTADDLDAYSADWDNYTFYSSSTANRFTVDKKCLISSTAGTKRAILDGVTVKGFHAAVTMKVTEEGTLRSGIVFRVNNIDKSLDKNGVLGANNIEGYSAILYKTPGTTDSYARVVMCIYKYGIVDGKYMYLGTVASKASEIPLTGFEKTQKAAAGQELTMDVNVIDDQVTVYFFNKDKPELKSESLIADLNNETDIEANTPSLKGVHYKSGAIGLTATNQAIFTDVSIGEPNYPSTDVGNLSDINSYTVYGSGAMQEGEYLTSNSSGTKKLIVNNLTVTDFKASMDMKIDPNGNLKTGLFFRVNEVGNGADAQTGWAIVVTRNFATNGETNPNRIDIVLFKWGYNNGKLSYLGEVSREVYKSGASFMDGKMAGEELTFVVSVLGAGIDATLYKKSDPSNKPVTFSSNLKFAGSKEKGDVAYFESGSIGLYLGNSVSDPVNYNMVRNFHIDDGSGVAVKGTTIARKVNTILGIPVTGENVLVMIIAAVFIISAGVMFGAYTYNKKGKHVIGEIVE